MPPRGKQVCRICGRTVGVVQVGRVATQVETELIQVVPASDTGESSSSSTFARRLHGELCAGYKMQDERRGQAEAAKRARRG